MTISAGARLGPYEIVAPLGAGGMGEVYRARDTRLGREVAIKVLPAEVSADAERVKRFEKEARSASALNHPNIVTIHDAGTTDGVSWIAMELVEGQTLRQIVAAGAMPPKKLLAIAPQIAEGLAAAHEVGIVHRDLKPENVMVTKDGRVKILDFGLAKLTGAISGSGEHSNLPTVTGTSPGIVLGTVGYMSPEQAAGHSVDFRSDQFAFGSILYEMATGKRAFMKKTAVDTLSAILNEEPEPIASVNPQIPTPMRWIIERCLAKEPSQRYSATDDLARDVATVRDRLSETSSGATEIARPARSKARIAAGLLVLALTAGAGYLAATLRVRPVSNPHVQKVTFQSGVLWRARFAPDGDTIVYAMVALGKDFAPPQIFETKAGSLNFRPLGLPPGDILSISTSGRLALALTSSADPLQFGRGTLAEVSLSGGTPRQILENVFGADWARDGRELAITRLVDGKTRLEFPIGTVLHEGNIDCPRVSPDGTKVAFSEKRLGRRFWELRVADRKGRVHTLKDDITGNIAWSFRGDEIWWMKFEAAIPVPYGFAGTISQNSEVHAVDMNGHDRLVATLTGDYFFHDLSRDGRLLVERNIEHIEMPASLPGQNERNLEWLDQGWPAALSRDSKVMISTDRGDPAGTSLAVYLRNTDGSAAVRLGEGAAVALSPDGRWVLANRRRGEINQLVLLPTGAGEERLLAMGNLVFGGWASFHSDGKSILYSAAEPNRPLRTYRQDLDGGIPTALSEEGLVPTLLSADGTMFLASNERDNEWSLIPVGDPTLKTARRVVRLPANHAPIHWSADGKSVLIMDAAMRPIRVERFDLATGNRTLWMTLAIPRRMGSGGLDNIVFSPDETAWVASYHSAFSELLVVDGLK